MNSPEPYPSDSDVHEWDDASLFVATGAEACDRSRRFGFESLNEVERVLGCLLWFEGDVNNGGFGSWIGFHEPKILIATVQALETVGAAEMARLVAPVINELGDLSPYASADEWQEYFLSLPDDYHDRLERLSFPYADLEERYLESVYMYAREHWREVRRMN